MVVTVAMKQRWNSRSGSGGWLSQSSLPLRKCLRKPCGPGGALAWLGPSCGLGPDPEKHMTDNIKHFSEENMSGKPVQNLQVSTSKINSDARLQGHTQNTEGHKNSLQRVLSG